MTTTDNHNASTSPEMPWLAHYPAAVPHDLGEFEFNNIGEYLHDMFSRYRDLPAYTNYEKTLTFGQIEEKARDFAAYLTKGLGYQPGDRFAIMMPNLLQFPIAFYGCLLAGVEVVNVNPLYKARELEHQLHDSGAKGILIAENFAHTLAEARHQLPELNDIMVTRFGDELGFVKGSIINITVRYILRLVPNYHFTEVIDYKKAMIKAKSLEFAPPELSLDDVAMLQYTGGTTGVAKGAMLTHKNLLANAKQIKFWIDDAITEQSLVLITALPLYHVFCCTVNCLCFPSLGMHTVLITNPRDMKSFVKTLKKYPFAVMTVVNTLLKGLLHAPGFKDLDFSNLQFVVAGGMALEKVVAEQWQEVTGNVVIEGYGLTETAPLVSVNLLFNDNYTGGIGYPVPGTTVSIRDEKGAVVPYGEPGEMWVKGPQVMKGYWKQAQETKDSFSKDGWFKTGDMATMDERGFLTIVDRKKDMVIVSGFNVYPSEVEAVILEHQDVLEVACIGLPSEDTGEMVKAFIVLKEGRTLTEKTLREFVKEGLTRYKRPKRYEFVEELPKSNVGKILRRELIRMEDEKTK